MMLGGAQGGPDDRPGPAPREWFGNGAAVLASPAVGIRVPRRIACVWAREPGTRSPAWVVVRGLR